MQNIDSDLIRGNIDTIILKTMLGGDMYGLDIIKEVENKSNGTYELKQPTLYSCLKRLENQELITSYWLDSDIGGKRHYYKLTEKGHAELEKKQEEWSRSKFIIDNLLGDFNSDDYRLVKKDDYDRIIEGKKFEYNEVLVPTPVTPEPTETEDSAEAEQIETDSSELENSETDVEVATAEETDEVEEPDETDTVTTSEQEDNELIYFSHESEPSEAENTYEEKPNEYASQESNILSSLRSQENEEINTYYGDKQSYINQVNTYEPKEAIQQDILDTETISVTSKVDESVDEFQKNIDKLNSFQMLGGSEAEEQEVAEEVEDIPTPPILEDEPPIFESEPEPVTEPEIVQAEQNQYQDNFLDELGELGLEEYKNDYAATDDENSPSLQAETSQTAEKATELETAESVTNIEEGQIEEESDSNYDYLDDDGYTFPTYEEDKVEPAPEPEPEPVFYQNYVASQTSFDDVIYRGNYQQTQSEPDEVLSTFAQKNNEPYKQKLQELSTYSKTTAERDDGLKKAKDINALKEEFEKEGITVSEFKRDVLDDSEKNYVLINRLNVIKSFILLFGFVFILSALYVILNSTGFKTTKGFSFMCFLYGFIPFGVYALYSLIMFLINPYKKIPAKYAPGIMLFISAIITVQLLLITYCVNLQLGLYSFTQAGYNHLNWIIPLVISFAPIVSTGIHCALFYSRNFNV